MIFAVRLYTSDGHGNGKKVSKTKRRFLKACVTVVAKMRDETK
jgi:hypothetical protein